MWNEKDHEGTALDWESFEAKVADIDRETQELKRTRGLPVSEPLYRGQPDARWHLETTFDRQRRAMTLDKYLTIMERTQPRIDAVPGKRWSGLGKEISALRRNGLSSITRFPTEDADTQTILSFMVYLRQHGFPSPLLDWTSDPHRAAFFAFRSIEEGTQEVAIYTFREWAGSMADGPDEEDAPLAMTLGPDIGNTSRRHSKQKAQYTWCVKKSSSNVSLDSYIFADHEDAISLPGFRMECDRCIETHRAGNVVDKYTIPASERRKALASLAQRDINKCALFGHSADNVIEDLWNELVIDSAV